MSSVLVKFSLPLRNVTMKDVLDAIVKVADHPIEYSVEDYAVVFSPRVETVSGEPVVVIGTPAAQIPRPLWTDGGQRPARPPAPADVSSQEAEESTSDDTCVETSPERFNVDFGRWRPAPSLQVGPAAAGAKGDFWNTVGVPWDDHHTESGLKFATGKRSPIRV
jgi:hypothetical protein